MARCRGTRQRFGQAGWLCAAVSLFMFLGAALASSQAAADIAGTWQGTVQTGGGGRILVKISRAGNGAADAGWKGVLYHGTESGMESEGTLIPAIALEGTALKFTVAAIEVGYEGKLNAEGTSMAGTWTQSSGSYALKLTRVTEDAAWPIPEPDKNMPQDADPAYEVATIKPSDPADGSRGFQTRGRYIRVANETVNDMISFAYGIHVKQIYGGPAWFGTEKYFVNGVPDIAGEPSLTQFRSIVRKLLADRFQFKTHMDKRELPVYVLTVAKGGPKMTRSLGNPNGPPNDEFSIAAWMKETNTTMGEFSKAMMYVLDKPVVDQTGLEGRWDFVVKWTPDVSQFTAIGARIPPPGDNPNALPGLFTAIQEQIGLKLEAVKAPADVLVVDHAERPSAN